jgi:hypothetical protein
LPPRFRVVALLLFGGMSLFMFGVVFALVHQAYSVAASPAWPVWLIAALVVLVATVGVFFALLAWGVLSDAPSQLGSWVHDKAEGMVAYLLNEGLLGGGSILILSGGSRSSYIEVAVGAAVLLCWLLFFVLIVRRELKLDLDVLDDPNDNRLFGRRHERGSYHDRDEGERDIGR